MRESEGKTKFPLHLSFKGCFGGSQESGKPQTAIFRGSLKAKGRTIPKKLKGSPVKFKYEDEVEEKTLPIVLSETRKQYKAIRNKND